MSVWVGRRIVVGVTGSIAAYKACQLVSSLVQHGAEVHVVMTKAATELVGPLTFQELTRQPVRVDMFGGSRLDPVVHVSLAQSADLIVVAPATANIIGKVASGIGDDLLSTTLMATKAPVLMAPAMNDAMWDNPVVQRNVALLKGLGYLFVEPTQGHLLCGTQGKGRLAPVESIMAAMSSALSTSDDLAGRVFLVTAGATREPIDPVRFISNRSSGRMGYAIAAAARQRGARVILVSGPSNLPPPPGVQLVTVETTNEMAEAVLERLPEADALIKAAAPADFAPETVSYDKIKKGSGELMLRLKPTRDILAEAGRRKRAGQIIVGFAAESRDLVDNARVKLANKHLDLIVANDIRLPGAGFDVDTNVVTLLAPEGQPESWPQMTKDEVAARLVDRVARLLMPGTNDPS